MLSQSLTLNECDDRGQGLAVVTPPPALPLADECEDDGTKTGVPPPPAPPWSSSSSPCSAAAPPPRPLHWTSPFSSSSYTPPPRWNSSPPPSSSHHRWASSSSSAVPVTPPVTPLSSVLFTAPVSVFSPHSSSSPLIPQNFLSPPPVSSTCFSHLPPLPPHVSSPSLSLAPPLLSLAHSLPPPSHIFSYSSSTPLMSLLSAAAPTSVSPPTSTHFPPLSSPPVASSLCSSTPAASSVRSTPTSLLPPPPVPSSVSTPTTSSPFSTVSLLSSPLLSHHTSSLLSPPPPPPLPLSSSFSTPTTSTPSTTVSFSSSPLLLSHHPSSLLSPSAQPTPCRCSSLLPQLLSAHRWEVRRLLRRALASLGRRLDSLERRSRRKIRRRRNRRQRGEGEEQEAAACSPSSLGTTPLSGLAVLPCSSSSSCSPASLPPVKCFSSPSSSSDTTDSVAPPVLSFSQTEQRRRRRGRTEEEEEDEEEKEEEDEDEEKEGSWRGRKRKKKKSAFSGFPVHNEKEEDEDGRFVGRMVISYRGGEAEEGVPLTLHNFNHRKHKRREEEATSESEKAVSLVVRQNGYRVAQVLHSSSSQHALHLLQRDQNFSQSDVFSIFSSQWHFSDFPPPPSPSSNYSAFRKWLSTFNPASMLRLSAVAVETLASVREGACGSPLRPLKDWTAPPSLSIDHCYMRSTQRQTFSARRQQKQRANHSARSLRFPRRSLALPPCQANRLPVALPVNQSAADSEYLSTNLEKCKRVSKIRIRRSSPRETLLTPMGLPKVKRLRKKEFSLEEIYTNKNYKSPSTNRSLETIFEEPREKDGALLLIGQQRRRRLLLFPDFTQPRKRKRPQGAGIPVAMVPRKRAAARRQYHGSAGEEEADLDVMLVERLSALEDFLTRQGLDV